MPAAKARGSAPYSQEGLFALLKTVEAAWDPRQMGAIPIHPFAHDYALCLSQVHIILLILTSFVSLMSI
jgi:hypothetical protein